LRSALNPTDALMTPIESNPRPHPRRTPLHPRRRCRPSSTSRVWSGRCARSTGASSSCWSRWSSREGRRQLDGLHMRPATRCWRWCSSRALGIPRRPHAGSRASSAPQRSAALRAFAGAGAKEGTSAQPAGGWSICAAAGAAHAGRDGPLCQRRHQQRWAVGQVRDQGPVRCDHLVTSRTSGGFSRSSPSTWPPSLLISSRSRKT